MVDGLCRERDSNPWTSDHETDALTNCWFCCTWLNGVIWLVATWTANPFIVRSERWADNKQRLQSAHVAALRHCKDQSDGLISSRAAHNVERVPPVHSSRRVCCVHVFASRAQLYCSLFGLEKWKLYFLFSSPNKPNITRFVGHQTVMFASASAG